MGASLGDIDGERGTQFARNSNQSDLSGWSVSLSADGTRVAIGAPNNDRKFCYSHDYPCQYQNRQLKIGNDIDGDYGLS